MILRQDSGHQCCVCPHEGVMLTNRAWFCDVHIRTGVLYLSKLLDTIRGLNEPEPLKPLEPEPVIELVVVEATPRPVRPPARRPKVDRSILRSMSDRDLRDVVADAMERGWEARRTNGGHVMLHHPTTGATAVTSTTRGGRGRGTANLRAALRRGEPGDNFTTL